MKIYQLILWSINFIHYVTSAVQIDKNSFISEGERKLNFNSIKFINYLHQNIDINKIQNKKMNNIK